jgi:hypothetical protein
MILRNRLFDTTLEAGDKSEISNVVQSEIYGPLLMGPLGPIGDPPMVRYLGKDAAGNSMFAPAAEDVDGNPLPQNARLLRAENPAPDEPDALRGADFYRAQREQLQARALERRDQRRWRKSQPKKKVG